MVDAWFDEWETPPWSMSLSTCDECFLHCCLGWSGTAVVPNDVLDEKESSDCGMTTAHVDWPILTMAKSFCLPSSHCNDVLRFVEMMLTTPSLQGYAICQYDFKALCGHSVSNAVTPLLICSVTTNSSYFRFKKRKRMGNVAKMIDEKLGNLLWVTVL